MMKLKRHPFTSLIIGLRLAQAVLTRPVPLATARAAYHIPAPLAMPPIPHIRTYAEQQTDLCDAMDGLLDWLQAKRLPRPTVRPMLRGLPVHDLIDASTSLCYNLIEAHRAGVLPNDDAQLRQLETRHSERHNRLCDTAEAKWAGYALPLPPRQQAFQVMPAEHRLH